MGNSNNKIILVTGGAGFIGTHLCRKLAEQGYGVRVIDLAAPKTAVPGVRYCQADMRTPGIVESQLEGVTEIIHLAATVSVPVCQKDPIESYSNNLTSTLLLLDAVRRGMKPGKNPVRVAFASTSAVYGARGDDGRALKENETATSFHSFYGAQKFASEQALDLYRKSFGIPSIPFRFFNVFGQGQDPASPYSGVITLFVKYARENRPLPLNGGGAQTRDFVSVHDIVAGLAAALTLPDESWNAQPINLGSGKTVTIRRLAELVQELAASRSSLADAPAREGDVVHSLSDIGRAKAVLGYTPKVELRAGLAELLKS